MRGDVTYSVVPGWSNVLLPPYIMFGLLLLNFFAGILFALTVKGLRNKK